LVGERWAPLVVRELILGPKRFTDLRAGLSGISPNVLTQRLEELEQSNVIRRRKLPTAASSRVYELIEWCLALGDVIKSLGRWAVRSPALMQGTPLSTDALILSFRTMFSSDAAGDLNANVELRLGEDRFHARIADGSLSLTRGPAPHPDATLTADPNTLAAIAYGGRKFAEAVRAGEVRVEGDRGVARRFLGLFPLPEATS
jgi:DNA-binding HxlR family transcriptional regulator/putative sterol carrier protein